MIKTSRLLFAIAVTIAGACGSALADDVDTLALTFSYSPKASGSDLADGYRKHLEWHIEKNDPILWYAWFVVEGERLGHFVDGAYDVTGAEFDARPDRAGDAADAVENFLPVANLEYRRIFRLRRDLGTSSFLEDRNPSPLMQVVYYRVRPGSQRVFEDAARIIASAATKQDMDYTIYELLTGAEGPMYVMYVPLFGFKSFDTVAVTLEAIAEQSLADERVVFVMEKLSKAARSADAEVWQYRADLSLIPSSE